MCRMCYVPAGRLRPNELYLLLEELSLLQKDGAGFLAWKASGRIQHRVELEWPYTRLVARALQLYKDGYSLLVHFRQASSGEKCKELCHPFWNARKGIGLCHNGHSVHHAAVAAYLRLQGMVFSDSKLYWHLLCNYSEERIKNARLQVMDGVWFVLRNREVSIQYWSGQLSWSRGVWASKFPFPWKGKVFSNLRCGMYQGDEVPKIVPTFQTEWNRREYLDFVRG